MKFTIILEDTRDGVHFDISGKHNGVQDHAPDSLACLLSAQIDANIKAMVKAQALHARAVTTSAHPVN